MIYYLTYNEPFNGIFNSQVIDVIKHIRKNHNQDIRLISFAPISFKLAAFKLKKEQIKAVEANAIIIPTLPVQYGWKFNWILLACYLLFVKRTSFICREIFASYIAMKCKNVGLIKKLCHDGRGANIAQIDEYAIFSGKLKNDVIEIEPFIINNADFRLSVSDNLVKYWRSKFNYIQNNHVVIPCTISTELFNKEISLDNIIKLRKNSGFNDDDFVFVFSGSNYEWQSIELINKFCEKLFELYNNIKIVFLSKKNQVIQSLENKYTNRIFSYWLEIDKVVDFLTQCDYGILIRESNYTNNTASPTKFAEYLAAGLPVVVSNNLEQANFVQENDCGFVINNNEMNLMDLNKKSFDDKIRIRDLAKKYFFKNSEKNFNSYQQILDNIK